MQDFQTRAIRIGMITLAIGVIANFIPALYLKIAYGVMPPWEDLLQIWIVAIGAFGASWIVQPLSFYPLLGAGASYIAWLVGNVAEIRVPAVTMAQKATDSEAGTPRGEVMAILGITSSVFITVTIITIFTFIGASVIPLLPPFVIKAFKFILPAIIGGVYAELSSQHFKMGVGTLILALIITYLSVHMIKMPAWLLSICIIAGGALVARVQYKLAKRA